MCEIADQQLINRDGKPFALLLSMTTSTLTLSKLIDDRRSRMVGLALAGVLALVSVGFLVAARNVGSRLPPSATRAVLPERAYDLPIVRSLPRPQTNRNRIIDMLPASSTVARR